MDAKTVSVFGLGKLGAPMVACFASKGHTVIGVDVNPDHVHLINQSLAPVFEPGLDMLLRTGHERISATDDYEVAIGRSEISFIIVPTPSEADGRFSTKHVLAAGENIGRALRKKPDFHLVVLTSTVLPGATEGELKPVLEAHSGKRCGVDFGLCYNPEFIALGSIIHDILIPDFIIIGQSDSRSGDLLASFYKTVCENDPPIARMNIVNAELTKLAVNSFLTMKISYANNLAEICERIPGADVEVVTSAVGLDTRIGQKYIKGAVGYGGPCFPRDNAAFAHMARRMGAVPTLAEATDQVNQRQLTRLVEQVMSKLPDGGKVGILGLSYKPNTDVVEKSQGIALARALADEGVPTMVYDPAAMDNARLVLGNAVAFSPSMEDCIRQVNVIVITTPWEEFRRIQPTHLTQNRSRPVLLDCWRMLDRQRFEGVAEYASAGVGPRRG